MPQNDLNPITAATRQKSGAIAEERHQHQPILTHDESISQSERLHKR